MEQQLVVFDLGGELYGVDVRSVVGIIRVQPITAVPRAPSFVQGVTNLRGTVLPVIDLKKRFDLKTGAEGRGRRPSLPESGRDQDRRIVVVEIEGGAVGVLVDAVTEVLRLPGEAIEPPPAIATTIETAFLSGIARWNERLIILLNLARVLTPGEKAGLRSLQTPA